MKGTLKLLSVFALAMLVATQPAIAQKNDDAKKDKKASKPDQKKSFMKNELDTVSYAIGMNIAQNLRKQGLESLNFDMVMRAMKDVYGNKDSVLNPEQANAVLNEYFTKLSESKSSGMKEKGAKFLEENKKKPGVISHPSGFQYIVMKEGTGPKPSLTDKVTTHYHGMLISGEVFDSSVQRGTPATFPLNGVIKGWQEALQLMPTGSKWKIFLPYDLAYGERGTGGSIGPYETLIFEVELISIEGK